MRLFSREIETWPCSVRRFGIVKNGFVIWCDVQKKWQNNPFLSASPVLLSVDGCEGIGTFEFVIESNLIFP